jgi:hypothetical protein
MARHKIAIGKATVARIIILRQKGTKARMDSQALFCY